MAFSTKEGNFQMEEDDLVSAHKEIKYLHEVIKDRDSKIESQVIVNQQLKRYVQYVEELKLLAEDRVRTLKLLLMKHKIPEKEIRQVILEDDNEKEAVLDDFTD